MIHTCISEVTQIVANRTQHGKITVVTVLSIAIFVMHLQESRKQVPPKDFARIVVSVGEFLSPVVRSLRGLFVVGPFESARENGCFDTKFAGDVAYFRATFDARDDIFHIDGFLRASVLTCDGAEETLSFPLAPLELTLASTTSAGYNCVSSVPCDLSFDERTASASHG